MYFYITLRHNEYKVSPVCVVNLNAHYCTPPGMTAHSAMWTLINFNNHAKTSFFSKLFCYNYHLGKAKQLFSTTELGRNSKFTQHFTQHWGQYWTFIAAADDTKVLSLKKVIRNSPEKQPAISEW